MLMFFKLLAGVIVVGNNGFQLTPPKRPKRLLSAFALLATLLFVGHAQAYFYTGTDFGGVDFVPVNGDILSGSFTNIGLFQINAGDTVTMGSGRLDIFAQRIVIGGVLKAGEFPDSSLTLSGDSINLVAGSKIDFSGTNSSTGIGGIGQGSAAGSVTLTAGTLGLDAGGKIAGPGYVVPAYLLDGGTLTSLGGAVDLGSTITITLADPVSPVPLPPSYLMLGSGLLGLGGLRRFLTSLA